MRRTVLLALACATVCAACASGGGSAARPPSSSTHPHEDAATPQAAALGFETSIGGRSHGLRYDCTRQRTISITRTSVAGDVPHVSDVEARPGGAYVVTVQYTGASAGYRYEVAHEPGGYCVSELLSARTVAMPSVTPSSPGSTGTTSPSAASGRAATPEGAALGFARSLGAGSLRDACLGGGPGLLITTSQPHSFVATKQRDGANWIVTLTNARHATDRNQYEVVQQGGGYCVSRVIPLGSLPTPAPSR